MWNSGPKKSGHSCSKRKHGNPKLGNGVCHQPWEYRQAVEERIEGKRSVRRWLESVQAGVDPDDCEE